MSSSFFILVFIIWKTSYNQIKIMSELKFPTEEVELPSKGLIYPKDNPLRRGHFNKSKLY